MADGNIVFSTALDNSGLEQGIKQAEKDIEELKRKISEKTSERNAIVEQLTEVDAKIAQAKKGSQELTELLQQGVDLAARRNVAEQELHGYNMELKEAEINQSKLASEYARTYQESDSVFRNSIAGVESRFNAFASKVSKRMKKLFVFSFVFGALSAFKSYLMGIINEDERFAGSVQTLVATLRGFAAPLISALIPPLTAIVNVLTAMITTLARLVDMVFHTDLVSSIQQARQAAQSSAAAADATNGQADAANKLAKAQKKANRQLMAFDELNVLNKNDSDDAANNIGNGLGGAGGGVGALPGMDLGKIDETLAEIMLILGAALLAVGAILAFSGINIPLGITLMAIGALMIYTAVSEQWDKLPNEVREAITAALVITGIVLLVIGAVLAFSGANIPLGIGMMAAGAILLWTAAAMNWDAMPGEVQQVISVLLGILGAALLVVGAVLTFSAANPALGIALMALGAAELASVVALNWASMPSEVRDTVADIMEAVGVAFLEIGIILTLASPTTAPLGVGLLLIGAATLATAVALQWETMPQKTRELVSEIGAIIGAALLVLGIFCIVTGVGIPLGMALIIAGAGSLVTAVAVNWDAILDKIKEVWGNLKSWFQSNVAQIFEASWWAERFKGIVNGLIEMLNNGLSAFGGFINELAGGISGILDFFGVGGYWFQIGIPQIPYLAQGAVIPPNREFMAVLGDQSAGRNLEAPEGLIRQIVREESGNQQTLYVLNQILAAVQSGKILECDGYTLAKVVNNRNAINSRVMGVR